MSRRALFACLLFTTALYGGPVKLRCDYLNNPLGTDSPAPQFSWQSDSPARNWKQTAYQITVSSSAERLKAGTADVWDSGKQVSSESVGISYGGPPLEPRRRYYWSVKVWDGEGKVSASVVSAWWETGLLTKNNWSAKWVSRKNPEDEADRAGIRWMWVAGQDALSVPPKTKATFRTTIDLAEKPFSAALFIIARADFIVKVNGKQTGAKKDWSDFDRQDICGELTPGKNVIEIEASALEPSFLRPAEKGKGAPAAIAVLVKITRPNGELLRTFSDAKWEAKLVGLNDQTWGAASAVAELDDKRFGDTGPLPQPAAVFRRDFTVAKPVQAARVYVTALGSYRLSVNGKEAGDAVLTPEFTDYRKRVYYQTYDVTSLLKNGSNAIGAILGDGWYRSPLIWTGIHLFPAPTRLIAQLEILYRDGTRETVGTDDSWSTAQSPIVMSQIYAGENYDARLEAPGWDKAGFQGKGWDPAALADAPEISISSPVTTPVQVGETLKPKTVTPGPNGVYIFDMGQNMVGWATLKAKGPPGTRIRLRFAEILNPDGSIYRENLRNADATDIFTLRGGGEEIFSPHFTFHGFKYVEVSGYPGKPGLDAISGRVVGSLNQPPAGMLDTSSALINKMWKIGIWGQRGNFVSIPTDCPQRDERLGWTGDAEAFWRTGSYNFDVASFTRKFMLDMIDAQSKKGAFPNVAPNLLPFGEGAPGWGDAGVIIPWTAWLQYGDKRFIEESWEQMRLWMEFIAGANPHYLRRKRVGPNFADWLAPDDRTPKDLVATAYWALIADMMSQMARAAGKDAEAKQYSELLENIRKAFQREFVKENGEVAGGTQTAYLLTLYTKMAPKGMETAMLNHLVADIDSRGGHLSTGFLGTPFLLFTLSQQGRTDVAYRLLLTETYPSWGYMLSKGATTWWERWNGDTGDPAMNSYNHYAFGSVVAWIFRTVAGIDTSADKPGFREITIRPQPDAHLTHARGEYDSVYGKIVSEWRGAPTGPFSLRVTVPPNTTAKVFLPAIPNATVFEGGKAIHTENEAGSYVLGVGSGSYQFEVK